jgi:hypothetical protein
MTAGSNESPKAILSGQQSFEQIILTTERKFAKKLGNSERLEKWSEVRFFGAARREWLGAWKRFLTGQGLASLFDIHAGVQQTLEPTKAFALAMLRLTGQAEVTLRNQAAVIYDAACEGDVEFFKNICKALRSRSRTEERERAFLPYNILCYWFAGLLWLMNDKPGWAALYAYTGKHIQKAAYRKARERLGLNGNRDRVKASPVLEYDPQMKIYKYGPGWPRMEPHLST